MGMIRVSDTRARFFFAKIDAVGLTAIFILVLSAEGNNEKKKRKTDGELVTPTSIIYLPIELIDMVLLNTDNSSNSNTNNSNYIREG